MRNRKIFLGPCFSNHRMFSFLDLTRPYLTYCNSRKVDQLKLTVLVPVY